MVWINRGCEAESPSASRCLLIEAFKLLEVDERSVRPERSLKFLASDEIAAL
jgi:hypothetical protein